MANGVDTYLRERRVRRCAIGVGMVAFVYTAPALAYLDPGTGSIILQGVLASIAVAAAAGGMFWHRLKTRLTSLLTRKKPPAAESGQDPSN